MVDILINDGGARVNAKDSRYDRSRAPKQAESAAKKAESAAKHRPRPEKQAQTKFLSAKLKMLGRSWGETLKDFFLIFPPLHISLIPPPLVRS